MNDDKPSLPCFTCEVVSEYVTLANSFTQELSNILIVPMWTLFLSIAGIWIVVNGYKFALGFLDIAGFSKEFVFVIIAAILTAGQGPGLVTMVYSAALSVMGSAASVALSVGAGVEGVSSQVPAGMSGMTALVETAERGVFKVFQMADQVGRQATLTNLMPIFYALALSAPFFLLLVVYFAQVVISIFRVMMLAALSPILMMGFGFGWGRGMAMTGLKTLLAAFMVLFGSTIALAVCLYGIAAMKVGDPSGGLTLRELSLSNPKLLVAISLGWLGTAFMAEATGISNSIANSQLTNTAAGIITAGATATGLAALKAAAPTMKEGGAYAGGAVVSGAAYGLGKAAGVASHYGAEAAARGSEAIRNFRKVTFDRS